MTDELEVTGPEEPEQEQQAEQQSEQPEDKASKPRKAKAKAREVTNLRKNPVTIGSKSYKQGEVCTLSAEDLANERMMAKVNRLIELGILGE